MVTLETTAGPERILRFTARTVDISDLDLATRRGGVTWHLLAASGTTSTVAGAPMTLYAEELSGTVTGLGDGPHPPARTVTITPDAIPQWLRNPVDQPSGTGIRTLVLEDVTLSRTRLVDGDLTIPGLHLREVRS
ncbi:hypothetical protein [Saccharothrix sp. ST-888]|uniref:hypothetical protein n=1 Tax=Saccharothrix sp. ST-888 TaxID=1427391 RepID=UPI0012E0A844|nr:hypothetical protein [Saccharothrix sp. ST-888]